jgi:hypothetical protein
MSGIPVPDVVVVLPGITGSVLAKDGREVWAPTPGALFHAVLGLGRPVKQLQIVADDDWKAPDLGDGITATRIMPDVHLIPGLWKIDGYGGLERFLLETFDLTPGDNYFAFAYDWRRDNRASAKRLQESCNSWVQRWREKSGNTAARLVFVCHSMGGLVARYFVEVLEGWRNTRAVITFGTPFYGSLNAVEFFVNEVSKGLGPLRIDLTPLVRSLTSARQLVPSYRCIDLPEGSAAIPNRDVLPGWQAAWDAPAKEFVEELEEAARRNREEPSFAADPVVYRPIVGTDQPTLQSAEVRGDKVELLFHRGGSDEGGDGTVPLLSAALSGTEDQRTFAPQQHARLQAYDPMLDHLKGVLTALYHVRIEDLRRVMTSWFSYRGDDLYLSGEPVAVELATRSSLDEDLLPLVEATITVTDRMTGQQVLTMAARVPRESQRFELGTLPAGTYLVEVSGRRDTAPVSDVIVVATPDEAVEV